MIFYRTVTYDKRQVFSFSDYPSDMIFIFDASQWVLGLKNWFGDIPMRAKRHEILNLEPSSLNRIFHSPFMWGTQGKNVYGDNGFNFTGTFTFQDPLADSFFKTVKHNDLNLTSVLNRNKFVNQTIYYHY